MKTQEEWEIERREAEETRERHLAFTAEISAKVKEFYARENGHSHLDAPEFLAALLEIFDVTDRDSDVGYATDQLYVKWTMEHFVGRKIANCKQRAEEIYNKLFELGHFGEENHCYGWGDNYAWVYPHKTKKIFVISTQSRNYLFILKKCEFGTDHITFHIRRFWDEFKREDLWDVDEIEDAGIVEVIRQADDLADRFSDHIGKDRLPGDGVKHDAYVRRPDLEWFRRLDFEPRCGDFRDSGYVLSTDKFSSAGMPPRVEGATHHFSDIGNAIFYMNAFYTHLVEQEDG